MMSDFFQEKKQMEQQYEKEKTMLLEELKLNQQIYESLAHQKEKLLQELREVKQIIKVPRMHFKYLEKMQYNDLMNQMNEISQK